MRACRIRGQGTSYYHAMNRLANRERLLGDVEKKYFLDLVRKVETFSGVRVLTYCLMDNHFHLLLEVPAENPFEIPESVVWERMKALYSKDAIAVVQADVARYRMQGNEKLAQQQLDSYRIRMVDLSQFMGTLQQRFAQWFNQRKGRCGKAWNDRFKSVLVESPAHYESAGHVGDSAVLKIAQYIELNPFRAGLVKDPKDYRWSGYGASVGGCAKARSGLMELISRHSHLQRGTWRTTQKIYRRNLYVAGAESGLTEAGRPLKKGFPSKKVAEVEAADGQLSLPELLRCHVRYFTQGKVIGSRAFVEKVFEAHKETGGLKRLIGPRELKGGNWDGLMGMSDVRGVPVQPSG
jgi:putative transposase